MLEYNNKKYISIQTLIECGFGYPEKGTKVLAREGRWDDYTNWYRFYEKKEKWDGIFVSPFASEVGKINAMEYEVFVEFSPLLFKLKEIELKTGYGK